ncbi:hypothetical protein [Sphingomonas hengshuiensis]|uniref:ASCH domain-containing protein n=1 Tax=Sphingomonas hengshuiensis TaxID=1609977 RepID=A0A7U4JAC2_9SPHN|nr:hypothetical protein [Sphingomonas hengshuiensis]AJP73146.1 hypothetical protein TS85_17125 [Sphingomonas hengshuiensis]
MVAYSFAPMFAEAVASLAKRQTVRAFRKRHARPGEALQLYTSMRTRSCRKLLAVDPVCVDLRHILIAHGALQPLFISIEGRDLDRDEIEAFAIADGFGGGAEPDGLAADRMADFWLRHHGAESFGGVVIRWEPRA